jgi:hypothetical protein
MGVPGLLGRLKASRTYFDTAQTLERLVDPSADTAPGKGLISFSICP